MALHRISERGRYAAHFSDTTETLTISCTSDKHWRFDLECPGLTEASELLDAAADLGASAEELQWLMQMVCGAESIIEHAPYDLHRFGHVGVSC